MPASWLSECRHRYLCLALGAPTTTELSRRGTGLAAGSPAAAAPSAGPCAARAGPRSRDGVRPLGQRVRDRLVVDPPAVEVRPRRLGCAVHPKRERSAVKPIRRARRASVAGERAGQRAATSMTAISATSQEELFTDDRKRSSPG